MANSKSEHETDKDRTPLAATFGGFGLVDDGGDVRHLERHGAESVTIELGRIPFALLREVVREWPMPASHAWLSVHAWGVVKVEAETIRVTVNRLNDSLGIALLVNKGKQVRIVDGVEVHKGELDSTGGGADPQSRPWGVPNRLPYFAGRELDVAAVVELLKRGDTILQGLSGIGKSALAAEVCATVSEDGCYSGGIFWLRATNPDLTAEWDRLGEVHFGIKHPRDRGAVAVRRIAACRRSVLIVLDDIDGGGTPAGPLPTGSHIRLLATSQSRRASGTQFARYAVQPLSNDASRLVVEAIADRHVPGLAELLRHVGGHAFALQQAGLALRDVEADAHEYLQHAHAKTDWLDPLWSRLPDHVQTAWASLTRLAPSSVSTAFLDACGVNRHSRALLHDAFILGKTSEDRWVLHQIARDFAVGRGGAAAIDRCLQGALVRVAAMSPSLEHQVYLSDAEHFDAIIDAAIASPAGRSSEVVTVLHAVVAARISAGEPAKAMDACRRAIAAFEAKGRSPPVDLATLRSDLTRSSQETIMNAAIACWAENGFNRTTMAMIAEEASLPPEELSSQFSTPLAIVIAAFDRGYSVVTSEVESLKAVTPRQIAGAYAGAALGTSKGRGEWPKWWVDANRADLMLMAEARIGTEVRRLLGETGKLRTDSLAGKLQAARTAQAGISPEFGPEVVAEMMRAVVSGLWLYELLYDDFDAERVTSALVALVDGSLWVEK